MDYFLEWYLINRIFLLEEYNMNNNKKVIVFTLLVSNVAMYPAEFEQTCKAYYQKAKQFIEENKEAVVTSAVVTGAVGGFWGCYKWLVRREQSLIEKITEQSGFTDEYNPDEGKISDYPCPNNFLIFSNAKIVKTGIILDGFKFFVVKADEVSLEDGAVHIPNNPDTTVLIPYTFAAVKGNNKILARFRCEVNKKENTALIYSTSYLNSACKQEIHQELIDEMKKYLNGEYPNIDIKQDVARLETEDFFKKNSLSR